MPKSTAYIENFPLLNSDAVSWSLRAGTAPVIGSFDMVPDDATALFNGGARQTPVTLTINPQNGNPVVVTNLWILNIAPGPNPFISTVTLADRRWFWSYAHPLKRYNMRRRVGNKIAIASDKLPDVVGVALNQSIPNYFFWPWSINQGKQWLAQEAFTDLMINPTDGVLQKEMQYWGQMAPFKFDTRLAGQAQGIPIEDLQIDDQGDAAVGRMTKLLPESEITVDYDGSVVLFSRTGGDESAIYQAILPEIPGGGHATLVSNAALRPSQINVKFTLEVEVRFDALENAVAQVGASLPPGSTVTANPTAGQIQVNYSRSGMQNVLPSVDYQLTVNGNTIPMGTYIFMDDAFNSWGNLPIAGATQQLDHPLIQRAFVPWLDLWEKLNQIGQQPNPTGGNSSPWVERIAAVQNNYRTTYRLPSAWTNQMLSFRAYRVATIDPQTGMRGPSLAYCDYALIYSQRQQARNASAGSVFDVAQNRSGYPQSGNLDSTATPAPAYITVMDQDQGIIHSNYRIDYNRLIEKVLPSQLLGGNSMPTTDISNRNRAITFDTLNKAGGYAALSPSFKFATILTCIPASPNTANQLFTVVVKPSDVQGIVPQGQNTGLLTAYGPQMDIHCGLDTARVMWLDSRSQDIEAIFGIQNGQAAQTPLTPNLQGLIVNIIDGSLTSGASLTNLAQGEAARVYAALADHYEGTVTGCMNGNVHLNGMTTDITHKLDPNGVTTTQLTLPSTAERMAKQIDVFRFLNSTSRAVILKSVQPQGGA